MGSSRAPGELETNSSGRTSFDFELPAELFAEGFESGDVSAWSYTRTDSTKKKGARTQMGCGASASE